MSSDQPDDIDQKLEELNDRENENQNRCFRRSAVRVANEIKRTAKAEGRLIPYMHACFRIMVDSVSLLEPAIGRDASIELIGLLESPDQARRIQPNLDEAEYESTVGWMSSCAYDNLANNTAALFGYNSDGMHQCINDGIQVCRRTGKMQCIVCFREYASQVYLAADDIDMAMHFSRLGMASESSPNNDRRWVGARRLAQLQVQAGDLVGALASIQDAIELIPTFHTPREAALRTYLTAREIAALNGSAATELMMEPEFPPKDEYPMLYLWQAQVEAIDDCVRGNYAAAISKLSAWDAELRSRKCLDDWFQTRLRLLCAIRMSGELGKLKPLAAELEAAAQTARDWYALHCMQRILDPSIPAAPVPSVKGFVTGPFAQPNLVSDKSSDEVQRSSERDETAPKPASDTADAAEASRHAPPPPEVQAVMQRLAALYQLGQDEGAEAEADNLRNEVMAMGQSSELALETGQWLLYLMTFLPYEKNHAEAVFAWAKSIAERLPVDAVNLNLLATTGARILGLYEVDAPPISSEEISALYRRSLDLDPNRAGNHQRAGRFYMTIGDEGEAERCYARAFRLDRTQSDVALPLAEIYNRSDRSRDALAVLDFCLREGNQDPQVAWEAAMTAMGQQSFEVALTYLQRYSETIDDNPWLYYYQSMALVQLQRHEEALSKATRLAEVQPELSFASNLLLACALGGLGDAAEFEIVLKKILEQRLADVDYLTIQGLARLLAMVRHTCECLPVDHPLFKKLEQMLIATGMCPDEMLSQYRKQAPETNGLSYFRCTIEQPLDQTWPTCCLNSQQSWERYVIRYGVLALSEAEARKSVSDFHGQGLLPAFVVTEIELLDDGFKDSPGPVWQGFPEEQ